MEDVHADAFPIYQHALRYHALGWSLIPVDPKTKKPPRGVRWKKYQSGRASEEQLRIWFVEKRYQGLAVVLGAVSGNLCCRDFDSQEAYNAWAKEMPDLAETLPTVASGRDEGGFHVFFCEEPEAFKEANPKGSGTVKYQDGSGELFGDDRYMILPPTKHKAGRGYRWMKSPEGFATPAREPKAKQQQPVPDIAIRDTGFLPGEPSVSGLPAVLKPIRKSLYTEDTEHTGITQRTQEDSGKTQENSSHIYSAAANLEKIERNGQTKKTSPPRAVNKAKPPPTDTSNLSEDAMDAIEEAIDATVPKQIGTKNDQVFQFCRRLKNIEELLPFSKVNGNIRALDGIASAWHDVAVKYNPAREFSETLIEFRYAWENVKIPYGKGTMDKIMQQVETMKPPAVAEKYRDTPKLQQLILLCRELQRLHGDKPFPLSCRKVAEVLEMKNKNGDPDFAKANRWLNLLRDDGTIFEAEKGLNKTKMASEYKYLLSLDD